jgi:hypothetical protein
MDDAAQSLGVQSVKQVDKLMIEGPTLRFAVGIFDTWANVQATVCELTAAGLAEDSFNCLGLHRVLSRVLAQHDDYVSLRDLPFPADADLSSATDGPLAACLAERLRMGEETLMAALAHWLIPRHARQLRDAAAAGKVILWVQLLDDDDERQAYRSLLARSSNSVGVHDIRGGLPADPGRSVTNRYKIVPHR